VSQLAKALVAVLELCLTWVEGYDSLALAMSACVLRPGNMDIIWTVTLMQCLFAIAWQTTAPNTRHRPTLHWSGRSQEALPVTVSQGPVCSPDYST